MVSGMSVTNIKNKIKAMRTLGQSPSSMLSSAFSRLMRAESTPADDALIGGIIDDVIGIAAESEKPAKPEGEVKA